MEGQSGPSGAAWNLSRETRDNPESVFKHPCGDVAVPVENAPYVDVVVAFKKKRGRGNVTATSTAGREDPARRRIELSRLPDAALYGCRRLPARL